MREIIIVGYQNYDFAKSLIVGEIVYEDFCLDLNSFGLLLFTSKNAILSLEQNSLKYPQMQIWKQIPSYVIGKSSAKTLQELGGSLACISPNAHGREFASFLESTLNPKIPILYLRAMNIVSSLDERLRKKGFDIYSQIAYRSKMLNLSSSSKPKKDSILLFTSPSAYRFFLQNFEWDLSYTAIALGRTTFESFEKNIKAEISTTQEICQTYLALQKRFK